MTPTERANLRRAEVGYVFQRLNLVPSLTAFENVMLPLDLDGLPVREARARAVEALNAVGLDHRLDRFPDDFSGGQQQRIAIARAIVGSRRLLLADEPTGSLDTRTGEGVIDLLAGLPAAVGTTVVLPGATTRDPTAMPLVFPWRIALLLVGVIPVVAGLVASLGSRVAQRQRPVAMSTLAFE